MAIEIKRIDDETFDVTVSAASVTTHRVTVPRAYAVKLGGEDVDVPTLLERSFEFLLDREPNTSILSRFDLSVIGRYFPEYEREIGKSL